MSEVQNEFLVRLHESKWLVIDNGNLRINKKRGLFRKEVAILLQAPADAIVTVDRDGSNFLIQFENNIPQLVIELRNERDIPHVEKQLNVIVDSNAQRREAKRQRIEHVATEHKELWEKFRNHAIMSSSVIDILGQLSGEPDWNLLDKFGSTLRNFSTTAEEIIGKTKKSIDDRSPLAIRSTCAELLKILDDEAQTLVNSRANELKTEESPTWVDFGNAILVNMLLNNLILRSYVKRGSNTTDPLEEDWKAIEPLLHLIQNSRALPITDERISQMAKEFFGSDISLSSKKLRDDFNNWLYGEDF